MLTVTDATVRFGSLAAVDGVDLTIADGTLLALLGASGCGKSTLLRAIAGLEPPTSGRICWDGTDLAGIPVHRRGFGLMFQDGVLFPHRTVGGNIGYGLARSGVRGQAAGRRIDELLELVGLPGYADRTVQTLSGGQAQRVALARALAPRPTLLLLDEPLASLDRALRDRLAQDLRAVLAATGTTALFVTHDQQEAFAVADTLAVMDAGRILQSGPVSRVRAEPQDAVVAGFVGYPSVVDAAAFAAATGWDPHRTRPAGPGIALPALPGPKVPVEPAGALPVAPRVALRAGALLVDPTGPVHAVCVAVHPGPDSTRLTVRLDHPPELPGLPDISALTGPRTDLAAGDPVRLRVDPGALALLPEAAGSPHLAG